MRMVAVRKNPAVPAGERIEAPGNSDRQALHTARKRGLIFRLDDEVQVVALNRVVDDPDAESFARVAQRRFHRLGPAVGAQIPDATPQPHGHVHRMPRGELRPPQMRHTRPDEPGMRPRSGPPRTLPLPPAFRELEGGLPLRDFHATRIAHIFGEGKFGARSRPDRSLVQTRYTL